jgi:hypothetical protein
MARKPKQETGRGSPAIKTGAIEPIAAPDVPRVTIKGSCDREHKRTIISKPNGGVTETIRYPKNAGTCGPLTIVCLDNTDRRIPGTEVTIEPNESLRQYSSTGSRTFTVVFYCSGDSGECKLEFDR